MQSSNIFTVGGTLSANAHGRDLDVSQAVEVVQRFSLMLADGSVVEVSRTEHPELFGLVIGGYGMYGIILDATSVTKTGCTNAASVDYKDFPACFRTVCDGHRRGVHAGAAVDRSRSESSEEMVVVLWRQAPAGAAEVSPSPRANVAGRFFLGISRKFHWAKKLRWYLQKVEAGQANSVSSRGTTPCSRRSHRSAAPVPVEKDTDILNKYYVPVQHFVHSRTVPAILLDNGANVMARRCVTAPNSTRCWRTPHGQCSRSSDDNIGSTRRK
jgi:hypothetical protein